MPVFIRLFAVNFLYNCASNSVTLLPPYLVDLGANQTLVGLYNNVNTLALIAAIAFFGRQLVTVNRPTAIRVGLGSLALSYVLSFVFSSSLPVLFLCKLLGALGFIFSYSLMMNMVYDLVPPEKRTGSIAIYSISGMITNPITSFGGEAVLRNFGGPGLFVMGIGFSLLALGVAFFLKDPPRHPDEAEPLTLVQVLGQRSLWPLFTVSFLFGAFFTTWMSFLPNFNKVHLNAANLSAFTVPFATVSILMRFFFSRQLDLLPPRRLLLFAFGCVGLGFAVMVFPASWPSVMVAGGLYGLGHSILFPLLSSLHVRAGGERQKSLYNNVFIVTNLGGAIILVPLLGLVADFFGFFFLWGGCLVIAAAAWFLCYRRADQKNPVTA